MDSTEAKSVAAGLRSFADYIEVNEPEAMYPHHQFNVYLTEFDYNHDEETNEYSSTVNEEKTNANIAAFIKAAGKVEKVWRDSSLELLVHFGDHIKLTGYVSREAVCRKVPTGETRIIPESPAIPAREEEVFEWVCEDPSLLRLTNG